MSSQEKGGKAMTKVETEVRIRTGDYYEALRIPPEARCIFPQKDKPFTISTSWGKDYEVHVHEPPSHPRPHIHVTKMRLINRFPSLKHKGTVVIEVTESKGARQYHIQ